MPEISEGCLERNRKTIPVLCGGMACAYLALCAVNAVYAIALALVCCAFYFFCKRIDTAFLLYSFFLPFGYMPFFSVLPFGMNAVKLLLVLVTILVLLFVLYKKPYRLDPSIIVLFAALTGLFGIAWGRSTSYAAIAFAGSAAGTLPTHTYLLNYASWTFLILLPMLLIAFYYRKPADLEKIIRTIAVSGAVLFGYLILAFVFRLGNKSDFEVIRTELANLTGLHGNDLSNCGILSFPLILSWAFAKKSRLAIASLLIITAGTVICFSRTAYYLILFGFFLYLLLSGKQKWILPAIAATAVAILLLAPDMVVERAVTGIGTGSYDEISAGRIEEIWKPILAELGDKPETILFGSGRYGIVSMDVWKQGGIPAVNHAHNMYLDSVLDVGILGLAVLLAFFLLLIVRFAKFAVIYRKNSPLHANLLLGCMISLICYLLSGFTGRSFFPSVANVSLWLVAGLGIAITESLKRENGDNPPLQAGTRQEAVGEGSP